jgi:hypothetical protein
MTDVPIEIQNWRQQLKDYQQSKKTALSELYRNPDYVPKITHATIKRSEYKFDPILNRYKDRALDENYYSQSVGPSKKLSLNYKSGAEYNIVTLENADLNSSQFDQSRKSNSLARNHITPFNIVTNEVYDPQHKLFRIRRRQPPEENYREFNIINNRYRKEHELRTTAELSNKKQNLERKYASTHHFDPIRGVYYFPDVEKENAESEELKTQQMIKAKLEKIPRSYKLRETINLNHEKSLVHSDGFSQYRSPEESRITRYKKRYEFETQAREKGNQAQDKTEDRALGRYFAQRFVEEYKEGVNPLTLQEIKRDDLRLEFAKGNKREHFLPFPKPSKKFTNYFGLGF